MARVLVMHKLHHKDPRGKGVPLCRGFYAKRWQRNPRTTTAWRLVTCKACLEYKR